MMETLAGRATVWQGIDPDGLYAGRIAGGACCGCGSDSVREVVDDGYKVQVPKDFAT